LELTFALVSGMVDVVSFVNLMKENPEWSRDFHHNIPSK
jgi:hypothetical protein